MAEPEVSAAVVLARPETQVFVVSALATGIPPYEKMTDTLFGYSQLIKQGVRAASELRSEIVDVYDDAYSMLDSPVRTEMRRAVAGELAPRTSGGYAYYPSRGELISARYFGHLTGLPWAYPALRFHTDGRINWTKTQVAVRRQVEQAESRLIVPGYFGYDLFNQIVLLNRGGSDRTGALYARALGADYDNWTNTDGIQSANPKYIDNAITIPELTRHEVREGANGGSGVLQGDTILDLDGSDVVTYVRNTFNPEGPFTKVVKDVSDFEVRTLDQSKPVISVTGREDVVMIDMADLGMADRIGYLERILRHMAKLGLALVQAPSAEDFSSLTIRETDQNRATIEELADYARRGLVSAAGRVVIRDIGMVYVVGEALRNNPQARRFTLMRALRTPIGRDNHQFDHTMEPVGNSQSPSLAFITEREAVKPLVEQLHAHEIEGKPSLFT